MSAACPSRGDTAVLGQEFNREESPVFLAALNQRGLSVTLSWKREMEQVVFQMPQTLILVTEIQQIFFNKCFFNFHLLLRQFLESLNGILEVFCHVGSVMDLLLGIMSVEIFMLLLQMLSTSSPSWFISFHFELSQSH